MSLSVQEGEDYLLSLSSGAKVIQTPIFYSEYFQPNQCFSVDFQMVVPITFQALKSSYLYKYIVAVGNQGGGIIITGTQKSMQQVQILSKNLKQQMEYLGRQFNYLQRDVPDLKIEYRFIPIRNSSQFCVVLQIKNISFTNDLIIIQKTKEVGCLWQKKIYQTYYLQKKIYPIESYFQFDIKGYAGVYLFEHLHKVLPKKIKQLRSDPRLPVKMVQLDQLKSHLIKTIKESMPNNFSYILLMVPSPRKKVLFDILGKHMEKNMNNYAFKMVKVPIGDYEVTDRIRLLQCPKNQAKRALNVIKQFDRNQHFKVISISKQTTEVRMFLNQFKQPYRYRLLYLFSDKLRKETPKITEPQFQVAKAHHYYRLVFSTEKIAIAFYFMINILKMKGNMMTYYSSK